MAQGVRDRGLVRIGAIIFGTVLGQRESPVLVSIRTVVLVVALLRALWPTGFGSGPGSAASPPPNRQKNPRGRTPGIILDIVIDCHSHRFIVRTFNTNIYSE